MYAGLWELARHVFIYSTVGMGNSLAFYIFKLSAELKCLVVILDNFVVVN
jgi:hypothetical protein